MLSSSYLLQTMCKMLAFDDISILIFINVDHYNYKVGDDNVYNLCLSTAHNDDIVN